LDHDLVKDMNSKQAVSLPGESAGRRRWARRLCLVLAVIFGISFAVDAETSTIVPQTCIWQHFTGLPCPFCGLVRSLLELSHGRLISALDYHLFGPLVYAGGLAALAWSFYAWVSKSEARPGAGFLRAAKLAAAVLGLLWLAWWVRRMIAG